MTELSLTPGLVRQIRLASLFYVIIIVAGLGAELGLRGHLIDLADAGGTATAILAAPGQFRPAIAADLIMALCDAGLAILLYLIFRSVRRVAGPFSRAHQVQRPARIVPVQAGGSKAGKDSNTGSVSSFSEGTLCEVTITRGHGPSSRSIGRKIGSGAVRDLLRPPSRTM